MVCAAYSEKTGLFCPFMSMTESQQIGLFTNLNTLADSDLATDFDKDFRTLAGLMANCFFMVTISLIVFWLFVSRRL